MDYAMLALVRRFLQIPLLHIYRSWASRTFNRYRSVLINTLTPCFLTPTTSSFTSNLNLLTCLRTVCIIFSARPIRLFTDITD